ncbi:hypothetical protein BGZ95_000610 [Linnemannia exigua]|uniref:F-box domain-containing protein n=1 Tax=Linnemannia exigua TaxID=604196 RepID=A0AAD4H4N2_9FUNG|nr:hypothetical protein BGZ95_000610 [Linnemannia exigua]
METSTVEAKPLFSRSCSLTLTPLTATLSRRHPRPQPHRCLELPEVLATIMSFLDEDTVCRVISLVSHLWLEHSRKLLPVRITVIWHSSWSSDLLDMKLLALKDDAIYFRCFITHPNIEQEYKGRRLYMALNKLQANIIEQEQLHYSDDQNNDDTPILFKTGRNGDPFGTLRSLYLHFGPYALSTALNAFPFPSSLSNLSIVGVRSDQPLDLGKIVDRCPFLEKLHIEGHAATWATARLVLDHQNRRWLHRLRALTLKDVHIVLSDLDYFFSISPRLTEVKLAGVSTGQDEELQDGLFETLKTLPMASRSSSLLPLSGVMPKKELTRWLERTWYAWLDLSLYVPSTTLSLLQGVVHCSSHLTSLELDIDLFGRRWFVDSDIGVDKAQYPGSDESTTHMGIWLCRRLNSLRVEIHNGMEALRTSSVHSRIVFGYISRVCPYLESLEIDVPFADETAWPQGTSLYSQLSLKLEGGLCLLAKLDRLRRLRISCERGRRTFDCEDYEVNWISCSPYHRMNHLFSTMTLEDDDEQVEEHLALEGDEDIVLFPPIDIENTTTALQSQDTLDHRTNSSHVVLDTGTDENVGKAEDDEPFVPEIPPAVCLVGVQQVIDDLQNLGLLHDVEVMIQWMQSDRFRPLPALKRLSLGFETLQRPKDEIRRLFPNSIEP